MAEDDVSGKDILEKAAEALPDWPLYKPFKFVGDVIMNQSGDPLHPGYDYVYVPREIANHCKTCQQRQRWELMEPSSVSHLGSIVTKLKGEFTKLVFRCKNCERATATYFFKIFITNKGGTIIKV